MSDAVHSLRVSYGLISQQVVDLPLPPKQASNNDNEDNAVLLIYSRSNGGLSLQSQAHGDGNVHHDDNSTIILATVFRGPSRLQTRVKNVFVEAPPSILARDDHNSFSLPLDCFVLLTAGIVLDFADCSVKVAMSRGKLFESGTGTPNSQSAVSPASQMGRSTDTPPQLEDTMTEERTEQLPKDDDLVPSKSKASDAASATAPATNILAASTAENVSQASEQHLDSDTESEDELGVPTKSTDQRNTPGLIKPLEANVAAIPEETLPKQDEPSQDGISSFPSSHQTPQKKYGISRKHSSVHSRDKSTASTIPNSAQSDFSRESASFFAVDTATSSAEKPAILADSGQTDTASAEDVDANEDDMTPTVNPKKRKSQVQASSSQDGADVRLLKAAKHGESSLDEIVISESNIGKLKTPSRPSAQQTSIQKTRGSQRASKAPATPAPKSSSTPSSGKIPNKVLLSSSQMSASEKSWLKKQTAVVEEIPGRRANFLCVVRDKVLPTTVKVLRSLIADKPVVSDQWVTDSKKTSTLLDPSDYLHTDLRGSGIKQNDRRHIWKGKTLFFTTSAAKSYGEGWGDIQLVASDAGATVVEWGNANKGGELLHDKANTILFGTDVTKDRDARVLLSEYSRIVYNTKMFSTAIVKADLDLDSDEFKLVLPS